MKRRWYAIRETDTHSLPMIGFEDTEDELLRLVQQIDPGAWPIWIVEMDTKGIILNQKYMEKKPEWLEQ